MEEWQLSKSRFTLLIVWSLDTLANAIPRMSLSRLCDRPFQLAAKR